MTAQTNVLELTWSLIAPQDALSSDSAIEYHLLLCQQQKEVDILHIQKLSYRLEYKKDNWWVGYDEQPGVEGMFCSVFYSV